MTATLKVETGDITACAVDAVVNAANNELGPGSGVNGALQRAAGPGLLQEMQSIGGCPTGEARITGGHDLPAQYVIHTVGPVWQNGDEGEPELLASAYESSLDLAAEHGLETVAFPALSTGVFGYPVEKAADVAAHSVTGWILGKGKKSGVKEITFVCFDEPTTKIFRQAVKDARPL